MSHSVLWRAPPRIKVVRSRRHEGEPRHPVERLFEAEIEQQGVEVVRLFSWPLGKQPKRFPSSLAALLQSPVGIGFTSIIGRIASAPVMRSRVRASAFT